MTVASTIALVVAVFILGITPGPAVFATIARAMASGLRPAFVFNIGVVLGDIVLMLLAVFGLAAVAQAMGDWFAVVKIVGGIYLVWLGWTLWTSEPAEPRPDQLVAARQFRRNLIGGFLLTLGNPKAIAFYAAFLPTFIDLRTVGAVDIVVIAAVIAAVLTTTNMSYGLLAAQARLLFKSRRAMRNLNRGAGTMMIGAGAVVAVR